MIRVCLGQRHRALAWSIPGLAAITPVALAGDLNPPAGPIAPTHKTLTQVEPRTPLSVATTPGDADSVFRITQSGVYYLTGDLLVPAGKSGIEVFSSTATEVSIDLGGFAIRSAAAGTLDGVTTGTGARFTLANGSILSMGGRGVLAEANSIVVERLRVANCQSFGLRLLGAGTIQSCSVESCTSGIGAFGAFHVERCLSFNNTSSGIFVTDDSTVHDCIAFGNDSYGIDLGTNSAARDCGAFSNGFAGITTSSGCIITRCRASANTANGIDAGDGVTIEEVEAVANGGQGVMTGNHAVLRAVSAILNGGAGINTAEFSRLTDCYSYSNAAGFVLGASAVVSGCIAQTNVAASADGFRAGARAQFTSCLAAQNASDGFELADFTALTDCRALQNGGDGVRAATRASILNCHAANNTGDGFELADFATLTDCRAVQNGGDGVRAAAHASILNCHAAINSVNGFEASDTANIQSCTAADNAQRGITINNGGLIDRCLTRNNASDGIFVNFSCAVTNNNCNGDGIAAGQQGGIRVIGQANRIDSNNITFADRGLMIDAGGNTIVRNSLKGNTVNFQIAGGNDAGPIGTAATATSPWANIQY